MTIFPLKSQFERLEFQERNFGRTQLMHSMCLWVKASSRVGSAMRQKKEIVSQSRTIGHLGSGTEGEYTSFSLHALCLASVAFKQICVISIALKRTDGSLKGELSDF